jgi:hypothetical protein
MPTEHSDSEMAGSTDSKRIANRPIAGDSGAAQPPEPPAYDKNLPPLPSLATRIKNWGDALSAIFKVALILVTIVGVGVFGWLALQHHWKARVLVIDVPDETAKALKAFGADLDVRMAIRAAVNERVNAVKQIIVIHGVDTDAQFKGDGTTSISFKEFGLEGSSDAILKVLDLVFDRPPSPTVRVEMSCVHAHCGDSQHEGRLIVTVTGPSGYRQESYTLMPGDHALARGLHQAVEEIADRVLELNEPLVASVWFLNRPAYSGEFANQRYRDLVKSVATAAAGKTFAEAGCLPDLATGASLIDRKELQSGVEAERRAAQNSSRHCQVEAETNIVYGLEQYACDQDAGIRQLVREQMTEATDHLAKMNWATPKNLGNVDYYRIPSALLDMTIITHLYWDGASDNPGLCPFPSAVKSMQGSSTATIVKELIHQASLALPAAAPEQIRHGVLTYLYGVMHSMIPPQDVVGRVETGMQLLKAVQSGESYDAHPARTFYLEGLIYLDLGYAALDTIGNAVSAQQRDAVVHSFEHDPAEADGNPETLLTAAYNRNTKSALAAFETAAGATGLPILLESATRPDALIALGDAQLVQGNLTLAAESYHRAIKDFVAQDEPISGEPSMVKVFARLALINNDGHSCNKADRRSGQWQQAWQELGLPAPDGCTLKANSPESSQHTLKSFVDLLQLVGPIGSCHKDWWNGAVSPPPLAVRGWLECLDQRAQILRSVQPDIEALDVELAVGLSQTDSAPISQTPR